MDDGAKDWQEHTNMARNITREDIIFRFMIMLQVRTMSFEASHLKDTVQVRLALCQVLSRQR